MSMNGQNGMALFQAQEDGTEQEDDGKDLFESSVADFDSNSVTGKMDSNEIFGNSKSEFSFGGSRSGQDILLHGSRGYASFNNSFTEVDFGSFDYDPAIANKGSFSESGEFVMNHVVGPSEQEGLPDQSDFAAVSSVEHRSRTNPFAPGAQQRQVQSTLVEPVRPPSRHQYHDIEFKYSSTMPDHQETRPFGGEPQVIHETLQHGFQPQHSQHQSFQPREESMGAFEQRQIADVSVEDVRQRQLQFNPQAHPLSLHHHVLCEGMQSFAQQAMGQQQSDDFNQMSNQQFLYNSAQPGQQHDFDFQQQLSSTSHSAQPQHHLGLSHTVHGISYQRVDGPQASFHVQTNLTAPQGFALNVTDSMYGGHMAPTNPTIQSLQGNVSIAAERQSPKTLFNGFDGNGSSASLGHTKNVADAMSEAMEKLSDSMRRTAMSRSMVKQFSGRSLLGKQGSLRMVVAKQRSVRVLPNQLSDRNLLGEHGPSSHGRSGIRRSSSMVKHQLQHPARSRSVRQLDPQQALNQSSHSMTLNIDGRNIGEL
jgi:hypothetical protein